jgi:hypothetical protein
VPRPPGWAAKAQTLYQQYLAHASSMLANDFGAVIGRQPA